MMTTSNESYPKLLSLAVHEFRTPASVVGGYLRMLQRDTDSPLTERQRKMIEEAERSCSRIVELVAELGEVSKIDAGLITFAQQPLDVFSLVQEVAGTVHESEDREVRLAVRGSSAEAPAIGDSARLRAAFQSIFRAILREQPAACTVVALRRIEEAGGLRSAVIVVAEETVVQDTYELEAGPFDEKRGGLGLLLPIARRVIEGHGGRLLAPIPPASAHVASNRGVAIISLPLRS
ncbi:MAG: HAMP domain-containing histidine kinase [Acidobacteria bacterium]|nr:HAMP domain-containing histidine kinase [Acidobacteriota bacterium]